MIWNRLVTIGVTFLFVGTIHAQAPGSIVSWGRVDWAQAYPPTGTDYVQVASGMAHGLALKIDGSIVSWGPDKYGQVSDTPSGNDFVQVSASGYNSVALKEDTSIVSWGSDWSGSVSGTPTDTGYIQVAGGFRYHSLALKEDGAIVSWGYDSQAQVLDTPTETGFVQVAGGGYHSLALKEDGSIVSWGSDVYGQVSGTPTNSDFVQIAGGVFHSVALKIDGSIVSWGRDDQGQITKTPTETGFVQVSGGRYHSLALKADGSIVSWGGDDYAQVNDTPTGTKFVQLAGGGYHSVALLLHQSSKTPQDQNVLVLPIPEDEGGYTIDNAPVVSLKFDSVSVAGDTFVTFTETSPTTPTGFELIGIGGGSTYIDIVTTATFDGFVEVCINYAGFSLAVEPKDLSLAHIVEGDWIDITTTNDLFRKVLCGSTPSFSYFAIVQVADPFELLSNLVTAVDALDSTNGVRRSLLSKLAKIERLILGDNTAAAANLVEKFIAKVQKYRGKHIAVVQADDLVRSASGLAAVLLF